MKETLPRTSSADQDVPGETARSLFEVYVLADRAAVSQTITGGISHSVANALQALTLAGSTSFSDHGAGQRLMSAARMLGRMAHPGEEIEAPILIPELLAEVDEWQRCQTALPQATVRFEVQAELPAVRTVSPYLHHALLAVLTNAKEAVGQRRDGSIVVSAFATPAGVSVTVTDNGPGIAADQLEKMFEPFYTTKGESHLGLGLTVARHLLVGPGSTLHATLPRGGGMRITITLPTWTT